MVQIAREVASEADLQMRMQGIVLLGAFLQADALRQARASMSDEQVYAGVEKALRKYFGAISAARPSVVSVVTPDRGGRFQRPGRSAKPLTDGASG